MSERRVLCSKCRKLLFVLKEPEGAKAIIEKPCERCGLVNEIDLSAIMTPTTEARRGPAVV